MNTKIISLLNKKAICIWLLAGIFSFPVFGEPFHDEDIEHRVLTLSSPVDVRYTSNVKKRIKQYTSLQKKMMEQLLGKTTLYFPEFENIFLQEGIPTDLKYLAVIESGLNPKARSRSGAAGLWQFMKTTGRMMDLKITSTLDERRDVEKSTHAAAQYLKHLYDRFGDWTLAIAAYNCGPGNVRKAIRKSGGKKDYWAIQKYLPRETRQYIPKFIAMSYVMNYYYEHGLIPELPPREFFHTVKALSFQRISFRELSKNTGLDIDVISTLNPQFIRNYIPKSKGNTYHLVLPIEHMIAADKKYDIQPFYPVVKALEEKKKEKKVEKPMSPRALISFQKLRPRKKITKISSMRSRKVLMRQPIDRRKRRIVR